MDARKIVVIVEEVEASRTALLWALHNLLRYGDIITLLHVFPSIKSRSKKKMRRLRLKGFQLALSFKEICNTFFNTNVEIVVAEAEGDEEGTRIAALVREIGASALPTVVPLQTQTADSSTNMDFSQIEIASLHVPDIHPPKIPYRICPDPSAIIWRSRKSKRRGVLRNQT
ncbi:hypothetical protein EZV62_024046 [Acer yangbiense]|uniref:UspA domain-containing protein n=1 Tax=Acer yangbiense TaxID=1000413 RepID=A0A5C7H510_9ROSI|nr:hypothetical protein EZV62_024046 [Acer yangbiense]